MRTGEVLGAAALIRWQHPTRGLLSPPSFIPLVDHPLGIDVGEWTIQAPLTQIEVWREAGLHLPISVNFGARHLLPPDFIMHLRGVLSRPPAARPHDLELGILETSAVEELRSSVSVDGAVREDGIALAVTIPQRDSRWPISSVTSRSTRVLYATCSKIRDNIPSWIHYWHWQGRLAGLHRGGSRIHSAW